jgi:hypothetical protein
LAQVWLFPLLLVQPKPQRSPGNTTRTTGVSVVKIDENGEMEFMLDDDDKRLVNEG